MWSESPSSSCWSDSCYPGSVERREGSLHSERLAPILIDNPNCPDICSGFVLTAHRVDDDTARNSGRVGHISSPSHTHSQIRTLPPAEPPVIAQLIPENGGEPITIDKDVSVVGRQDEGCDITIEHKSVSKIHCVIVRTDGLLFVRDLLSTNGTRVNGQRVTRAALLPGDVLAVAHAKFRVHLGPSPANSEPAAPNATQAMAYVNPPKPLGTAQESPLVSRTGDDSFQLKELPERE